MPVAVLENFSQSQYFGGRVRWRRCAAFYILRVYCGFAPYAPVNSCTLSEMGSGLFKTEGDHGLGAGRALRGQNGRKECSKTKDGRGLGEDGRIPGLDTV